MYTMCYRYDQLHIRMMIHMVSLLQISSQKSSYHTTLVLFLVLTLPKDLQHYLLQLHQSHHLHQHIQVRFQFLSFYWVVENLILDSYYITFRRTIGSNIFQPIGITPCKPIIISQYFFSITIIPKLKLTL